MKKKRFNAKFRGRVGRKTSMLKKVNVCNVKIYVTRSAKRGLIAFPNFQV